jgi:7,8-dihydropterin-6-yl-methyl-4-(beta-D-ribofuranosyl)aminobenzene 5'-phosphate synthase
MKLSHAIFAASLLPLAAAPAANRITILYDAFGKPSNLKKDWGYSALIEYEGKRILFDTGNNAETLEHNAQALKIDLRHLDFVVLSHRHGDHTSGLNYLLTVNPGVTIYTPTEIAGFGTPVMPAIVTATQRHIASLPPEMHYFDGEAPPLAPSGSPWPTAHFVQLDKTTEVLPGFFLISLVSDVAGTQEMHEISLAFRTSRGLVLVVGCSHPGIEKIVKQAAALDPRIYSVFGGFHLLGTPDAQVAEIAHHLHDQWKIEQIGPGHCSGVAAFAALRNLYKDKYIYTGLGSIIELPGE